MFLTTIKRKFKKKLLQISGQKKHLKIGIDCNHQWYGNYYGGFYVCPNLINENSIVYSIGIGEDISFDQAVILKHGCTIHGFDPTPRSIEWLKQQSGIEKFIFHPFGLDKISGYVDFYLPKDNNHVSGSLVKQNNVSQDNVVKVEMKSFNDLVKNLDHDEIDVLKMDIEGSEYEVLESILSSGVKIGQILIEFHDRFVADGKMKTQNAINLLKRNGYEIFAVSDTFDEVSFIKKDLLGNSN